LGHTHRQRGDQKPDDSCFVLETIGDGMFLKHQPWVDGFVKQDMVPDIEWNMWSNRMSPFKRVSEGLEILYVSGGGPSVGRLMWTARMEHLVQASYQSHQHAWDILRQATPSSQRAFWGLTKRDFLDRDYTANAPASGWLLAWVGTPVRWVNKARPPALRFRPNGWVEVPGKPW
jgi:hypothetical protein